MKKLSLVTFLMSFSFLFNAQTVTIGSQVWMTKNLDVSIFRNGDPIPQAKTDEEWQRAGENKQPAWCYYENISRNGEKYGKLYNWYAVNDPRGLAPIGYHIPTDAEWTKLTDFLGGQSSKVWQSLKSTYGWNSYNWDNKTNDGNGSNISGFSGFPAGMRSSDGEFRDIGNMGYWWSSSLFYTNLAWYRYLSHFAESEAYNYGNGTTKYGFSVRCLKDFKE